MKSIAIHALEIAKNIQSSAPDHYLPPSTGKRPRSQSVLPRSMFSETRGYIEKVVDQINGTYENGWFDSCAVMMRRLLETLIIECYETHHLDGNIKNPQTGDFKYLSDLINLTINEQSWNIGRNSRRVLPKLKSIGDYSAHSRRYNAHREDIDKLIEEFRIVCQELMYLAKLK